MRIALNIAACGLLALRAMSQSTWTVEPLDIKPAGDDFAPALVDSNLVIASLRDRAQAVSYTDTKTNKPLVDLYEMRLRDGVPGHPKLMDGSLCTPFNDGPASFSPNGDTICITRNVANTNGGKRSGELLGLFFAVKENGTWSAVEPFPFNGESWSVMHGSFSADGHALYFASDAPGGLGGSDIYVSKKVGDSWGPPTNLGSEVNSAANEAFPSVDAAGVLYFSSDRAGGMGKLDLYSCAPEGSDYTLPLALPAPINSIGNDMGWATNADPVSGYFSSDREGKGRIYSFAQHPEPFRNCAEQKPTVLCYAFEDEGSFNTDTLPLRYEWEFGDGQRMAGLQATHCYTSPGTYAVKLNIVDTLTQGVYFNETGYDLEVVADEQAVITGPDSLGTGVAADFDMALSDLPGFTAKEVHWDFGDSTLGMGQKLEHAFATAGTYRIKLDLIGRPDGQGGFLHHCVFRDVHVVDGYRPPGTTQPVLAVAGPQGDGYRFNYAALPNDPSEASLENAQDKSFSVQLFTSATRIGLNDARFIPIRRHYPVVERYLPKERLYSYSIGSGKTPMAVYDTYAFAKRSGFKESKVLLDPKEKPMAMDAVETMPLAALDNSIIRVSTVRFKTGERIFDVSFKASLDRVLGVIRKYPQVELVIEAHTDNVGSDASNLALSTDRAQGVVDYFTSQGVDASRLRPIGFGEDRPIADNSTEKGRAENRRVDFRLNVPNGDQTAHP